MGPTTTRSGPNPLTFQGPTSFIAIIVALEPVPDYGADSAPRYGPAKAGRATRAKGAAEARTVEP